MYRLAQSRSCYLSFVSCDLCLRRQRLDLALSSSGHKYHHSRLLEPPRKARNQEEQQHQGNARNQLDLAPQREMPQPLSHQPCSGIQDSQHIPVCQAERHQARHPPSEYTRKLCRKNEMNESVHAEQKKALPSRSVLKSKRRRLPSRTLPHSAARTWRTFSVSLRMCTGILFSASSFNPRIYVPTP